MFFLHWRRRICDSQIICFKGAGQVTANQGGSIVRTSDIENLNSYADAMDLSMFATREDVAAIGAKVDKLIAEIGGMNV